MKKVLIVFILFITISIQAQTTYYVSLSGNDANDGLTENTAWRTFSYAASSSSPVTSGDTVYIKAGDYGNDDVYVEKNYNPNDARIAFIGYQNTPGDLSSFDFAYGDNVDASLMPLIDAGDRTADVGINIVDAYSITIKNIQITNSLSGVYVWNTSATNSNHILENIFFKNIGWEYSTAIVMNKANSNSILNCLIVNATGAGMDIWGDNNHIENCKIYSNESQLIADGSYTSMDYYIAIKGDNNTVQNCYAERDGNLADVGHGFEIKENGQHNLFVDCTVKNMIAGCFSVRWSGVQNNEFRNCHALGGVSDDVAAFVIREGASYNVFNSCTADGCEAGVRFYLNGEDADYCGHDNSFNNCLIKNSEWAIDFNTYFYNSLPANNNILANCVIDQANYLFNCDRPNTGNKMLNCIVTNVSNLKSGNNALNFEYTYSNFFNTGFPMPTGANNISSDPLFITSNDYHLQATSPCIDLGTSQNAPLLDFEGISRPQGSGFDMGMYEYHTALGTDAFAVDDITVFPNPTARMINLPNQYTNQYYEVVTTLGQIVKSGYLLTNEIDLSALKNGVYYINITDNESHKVARVVKK